ncbi:UvrD-helicase domain-containing protein [Brevibacillus sp. TJ4]|uniref:UvrD-helicase domain-containing protein n=1 Tax=Brevibacillus sp. TJ4 TaxID=3234853 RepID=UPI003BA32052
MPKHSYLTVSIRDNIQKEILQTYLLNGVKVIVFTDRDHDFEDLRAYRDAKLLQIYVTEGNELSKYPMLSIVDGQFSSLLERRALKHFSKSSHFNLEQYLVEHAPSDVHLSVKAGAGTGKTTVMIQRILYILQTTETSLKELAMITFTREAAHRMFQKLREEFYCRYQATGAVKYLTYIEELPSMQISTIHSFAKELIKEMGSIIGYGSNVSIKSLKMQRSAIIERYINEWVQSENRDRELLALFNDIPLYKVIEIANDFWEEMEQKGLSENEIKCIHWGGAATPSASLHRLFSTIFPLCEKELQELKIDSNAITLSDLTRQLDYITRHSSVFQNKKKTLSYLFIDEFQDTDDIQIKLASRLVGAYNMKLFVVGDIKQSIYRFRGAKYTAFDILRNQLKSITGGTMRNYSLTTNYRSSVRLLDQMETYFSAWGKIDFLPYGKKDSLKGVRQSSEEQSLLVQKRTFERHSDLQESHTINMINMAKEGLENPRKQRIAVLVRTNNQAFYIQQWCKKAGIDVQLDIGGTFYVSPTVKDFKALVDALLFPRRPIALFNLLNSSYSNTYVGWSALTSFGGDESRVSEFLTSLNPLGNWEKYLEDLRITPVLAVIREIVEKTNPVSRYYLTELAQLNQERPDQENETEARARALQYELNLNHLFELIHNQFSSEFVSLYSLQSWLQLQIAVNRDEDEPLLDEKDQGERVHVMTVHKSKGLEFHTIILPFTDKVFRYVFNELLLEKLEDKWHAGWFIRDGEAEYKNDNHVRLQSTEENESIKEETRLLYVAMTRAEERLWLIANQKYTYNNWYMLLAKQGVHTHV